MTGRGLFIFRQLFLHLVEQVRVCAAKRSNESPSGAFKRQNGLAQQDGGASPRQVRICFSLTNTPALCYLYCIETVSLLTEPCGAPQCRDGGRVNADRLGSLAQLLRKAAFFVVGSCFYKQGALNGGIFCPQTRRFSAAILTDCKGKQRSMQTKMPARRCAMAVKTAS